MTVAVIRARRAAGTTLSAHTRSARYKNANLDFGGHLLPKYGERNAIALARCPALNDDWACTVAMHSGGGCVGGVCAWCAAWHGCCKPGSSWVVSKTTLDDERTRVEDRGVLPHLVSLSVQ